MGNNKEWIRINFARCFSEQGAKLVEDIKDEDLLIIPCVEICSVFAVNSGLIADFSH